MTVYKCDMCGEVHENISEMDNVVISYAGKASVSYPRDGKFHICSACRPKLFELLHAYDDKDGDRMNLIKLPDGIINGKYVYVNPNNVTYLYERDDKTYIGTVDTEQDDQGLCVPLPIDEVAGRLVNGNALYDVIRALKKNSEDGDNNDKS